MKPWATVLIILALLIAIAALVLAIIWRKQPTPNPTVPTQMGGIIDTINAGLPNDVSFTPNSFINFTVVKTRVNSTTIRGSVTLDSSNIIVTRDAGPMTDLTCSFSFLPDIIGTGVQGPVNFMGNGTAEGTAPPGPVAIMQRPVFVSGTGIVFCTLHYSFGGNSVPAGLPIQLNFHIAYQFEASG